MSIQLFFIDKLLRLTAKRRFRRNSDVMELRALMSEMPLRPAPGYVTVALVTIGGVKAERLRTTIAQPFEVDGHFIRISTCVGTVVSDNRADPLDSLLQAADARLYQAKRTRNGGTRRVA